MYLLDFGGTYFRLAKKEKIIEKIEYNKTSIKKIVYLINKYRRIEGISYAGIVLQEDKTSKLVLIPNKNIKLKIKKSIVSENDANLIALAHSHGKETIVALILGTGIGVGCVYRGTLLNGNFGEIGHINTGKTELEKELLEKFRNGKKFEDLTKKEEQEFLRKVAKIIECLWYIFFFDKLVLHGSIGFFVYQRRKELTKYLKIQKEFKKPFKIVLSDESDVFRGLIKLIKFKNDTKEFKTPEYQKLCR